MTSRATKPSSEQLPFTLKAPPRGSGASTDPAALLESPLLDHVMHRSRSVPLHATPAKPKKGPKGGWGLAPFERASLLAYLREQAAVRRAIEARFAEEDAPSADPWAQARVLHLILEPLDVPTPSRLKAFRDWHKDKSPKELAALFDKPDTRSKFFVVLGVDWDGEHPRTAYFRDSVLFEWQWG